MELYNLGIGLTVVDHATKPIKSVDAALVSLASSTEAATKAAGGLDHALVGGSVAPAMDEAAEGGEDLTIKITETGLAFNRFTASAGLLSKALGLVGTDLQGLPRWMSQVRDEQGRFTSVTWENMDALERVALGAGKTVGSFRELLSTATKVHPAFSALARELKESGQAISGFVQDVENLEFLGRERDTFLELEDSSRKMAAGFGEGREAAFELRSDMLQLVGTTQFSIGEVTRMTQGLAAAGVSLTELSEDQQQAFIALNDLYGVSGQEIAKADSAMRTFGGSMVGALDDATKFQSAFRMPGMMEQLPGVIEGAMDATVSFGKAVVGSGAGIVKSVSQTAGVYAKAFGKTMAEAVQAAQRTFERFARASQTQRRVFLGLSDSFDPLQMAMMETGISLDQSGALMRQAQTDTLGFVTSLRGHIDSIPSQFLRDRFMEQLRDELPAELMRAIEHTEDYNAMVREQEEAERRRALGTAAGVQSFDELTSGMLDTTKELQKMWFNVKQLGIAFLTQTGLIDVLKDAFGGAKDTLASLSLTIKDFIESERMREWGQALAPILGTVGKGVLLLGTAFGTLLGVAGGATGAIGKLNAIGKLFGRFPKLAGALRAIGPRLLKILGPIGLIVSGIDAVMDGMDRMSKVLSDPEASGLDIFQGAVETAIVTLGTFLDNILLGIPSWLAEKFFPELGDIWEHGLSDIIGGIGLSFKVSFFEIKSLGITVGKFLLEHMGGMWVSVAQIALSSFEKISNAIVAIKGVGQFVVDAFSGSWEKGWAAIKVAGLTAAKAISDMLLGENGILSGALTAVEKLLDYAYNYGPRGASDMALEALTAIRGVRSSAVGFGRDMAASLTAAADEQARISGLGADWETTQQRIAAEQKAVTSGVAGMKEGLDDAHQSALKFMDDQKVIAETEVANSRAELELNRRKRKENNENFGEAAEFRRRAKSHTEQALRELAEKGTALSASGMREAERRLRSHMEKSLSDIASSVAKGEIELDEGITRFAEAKRRGLEAAMKGKAPGEVADSAGKGAGAGGIPAEAWAALVRKLEGRGGGDQKVRVVFRGVGNGIDEHMARKASVEEAQM